MRGFFILAVLALSGCSAEKSQNNHAVDGSGDAAEAAAQLLPGSYSMTENPNAQAVNLAQSLIGQTCVADTSLSGYDRFLVIDGEGQTARGRAISAFAGPRPIEEYGVLLDRLAISLDPKSKDSQGFSLDIERLTKSDDGSVTLRARPDNGILSDWTIACGPKQGGSAAWTKRYSHALELLN